MIIFDPRLHIDVEAAGYIERTLMPLYESPTVIVADVYPFPLTAEYRNEDVLVRAATGEEVTAFLTTGIIHNPDDFEWPGDPGSFMAGEIDWQETQDSEVQTNRACYLWSGEVILVSGSGSAGPFFVHREAARAWALATALSLPERDVYGIQVVPYACVRSFAPGLMAGGEAEFKRLNRFWIAPVKSWGQVEQLALPGPGT